MRVATRNGYIEGLEKVVAHVIDHPDLDADPRALAAIAGFSIFHFHRIFRGMMGETLADFVRRIRLERASWQIADGVSVGEVAFEAGFESHEAFTRAFKAAFGFAPSACRRSDFNHSLPNATGTNFSPSGGKLVLRCLTEETKMNVEIRNLAAQRAVAMRHIGPYMQIGATFGKLVDWAAMHGLDGHEMLAVYYDNPVIVPPADLRSDACVVVDDDYQISDESVSIVTIPAGSYAVATCVGPYTGLGESWGIFIGQWFPSSGHKMAMCGEVTCFEKYVNDVRSTPPEQLITELSQAIEAKSSVPRMGL
jgi:AraC family transcriptional regulator